MRGVIHTVLIWTEDVRRLAPFYTEKLGLEVDQEGEEFAIFKPSSPGATQFGLGKHSAVKGQTKEPDRIMINFGVDDCKAEYEQPEGERRRVHARAEHRSRRRVHDRDVPRPGRQHAAAVPAAEIGSIALDQGGCHRSGQRPVIPRVHRPRIQ